LAFRPLTPALEGKGDPDEKSMKGTVKREDLPHCSECKGLLRPDVVWFGESLRESVITRCYSLLESCDFFLVVGTSAVVYPAASFVPLAHERGIPVAEVNYDKTPNSNICDFAFQGKAGDILPGLLDVSL